MAKIELNFSTPLVVQEQNRDEEQLKIIQEQILAISGWKSSKDRLPYTLNFVIQTSKPLI